MEFRPQMTFGSYKGVMLCNRPSSQVEKIKSIPEAGEGGFICGTVKRPWGSNVAIPEKTRVLNRLSKKDGALSKHKKWLKELKRKKDAKEIEFQQNKEEQEERKRNFIARAAKKRALARGIPHEEADHLNEYNKQGIGHVQSKQSDIRPVWAMTEAAANTADEQKHICEEENLLSFVENLDFDKYTDDIELQMLMEQVKSRIQCLEKEKRKDESRLRVVADVSSINPAFHAFLQPRIKYLIKTFYLLLCRLRELLRILIVMVRICFRWMKF